MITVICDQHPKPYKVTRYARDTGRGPSVGPSLTGKREPGGWCEVPPPEVARYRRAIRAAEDDVRTRQAAGEDVAAVDRFRARPTAPRTEDRRPGTQQVANLEHPAWRPATLDNLDDQGSVAAPVARVVCDNRCPRCGKDVPVRGERMTRILDGLESLGKTEVYLWSPKGVRRIDLEDLAARHME